MMPNLSTLLSSPELLPLDLWQPSITSDCRVRSEPVQNAIQKTTGLIVNLGGARGNTGTFYGEVYSLHDESAVSEFRYFDRGQARGIYDEIANFVLASCDLSASRRILDVGCGKGLLLSRLKKRLPDRSFFGVEPSANAHKFFAEVLPDVAVFEGSFEKSPFSVERFDLILSNGVLEHVEDPEAFLLALRASLADGGRLFIGVPNFANNPADLLTFDHLSRFTPEVLQRFFVRAGLKVRASLVSEQRVPMWFVLEKSEASDSTGADVEGVLLQARASEAQVRKVFESYSAAASEAKRKGSRVAVYGTGAFLHLAPHYSALDPDALGRVVDDNSSLWGVERCGRKIESPGNLVGASDITEIVFAANPCYLPLMSRKLRELGLGKSISIHEPRF
jgi:SAM-dependent methyltransferase